VTHEALLTWLAAREPEPPAALAQRVRMAVTAVDLAAAEGIADALAEAAFPALDRATESGRRDRGVAADLLVADALITYALEAQAVHAPDALEAFSTELARRAGAGL